MAPLSGTLCHHRARAGTRSVRGWPGGHVTRSWRSLCTRVALVAFTATLTAAAPAALAADPLAVDDSFSRPDAKTLGTAGSGQVWTQHSGSFSVLAGTAAGSGGLGLASVDSGRADAAVSVTVAVPGPEHWLVVRLQDGDDYWRFGRASSGSYRLQLVRAGAVSTPGVTSLADLGATAGDRLECRTGGTLTCFVNGRLVARTADATFAPATRHGLATWQGSSVRFDDFRAGPVPPVPDLSTALTAPTQVPAGGTLRATAVVANTGLGTATSTVLVWSVPSDLTAVSGSTTAGSCTARSGQLRCPVGNLAAGGEVTATLDAVTPVRSGTVALAVAATQTSVDGNSADDQAEASVLLRTDLEPGTVVADGFSRADDLSGLGVGETGHGWTTHSGDPAVRDGAASTGSGYGLASLDSGVSNGTVAVTVSALGSEYWLVTRLAGPADYWRFGRSGGGAYRLQLITGNALGNPVLDVRAQVVPRAGDRLSCRLTDTAITCSVGEVVVVRTTDGTGRGATRHGLAGYVSPETRLDAFAVVAPSPRPDLRTSLAAPRLLPTDSSTTVTATVVNGGVATAPQTSVLVTLPAGASPANGQPATCAVAGLTVSCRLGDLAPGRSAGVTVKVRAPSTPGPVTTTAMATSTSPDDDNADDGSSAGSLVYDAAQPAPLAYDSFSRGDATSPGTSETGQAWRVHSGTLAVVSGAAAPGQAFVLATLDTAVRNGVVGLRVVQPGTEFWSVVRYQDAANYWRFGRSGGGPYQLQLIKANALTTPVVEMLATVSAAAGDRLECRAGSGLTCSVNGVSVARTLDTAFAAATAHGIATWYSPETRLDDLSVTELPRVPDVTATLTGTRSVLVSGALTFRATVENVGTANADSTVLTGSLPTGTTGLTVSPSVGSCSRSGTTFSCSFGQLTAGSSRTVEVRATAPAAAGATTSSVTARTASTDGDRSNDSATLTTTVRLPTPPGTVVLDDFDRADATTLGTSLSGQPWTVHSGGFRVTAKQAAASTAGVNLASLDTGFAAGTYDLTVTAGATERWWLALRVQDAANHYRIGPDPSSGQYGLVKLVNGLERPLYAYNLRRATRAADGDVLRVVVRPDDGIHLWVNGIQVFDAGDPDLLDETGFGFGSASTSPRFDDLVVSSVLEAYPVSDTFSRVDTADTLGAPEQGTLYPWRVWLGGTWAVRSGQAAPIGGGGVVALDASTESAGVRARFSTLGSEQWIVFRYAEDGSYYRYGATAGGRYQVQYVKGYAVQPMPVAVQVTSPPLVAAGQLAAVVQRLDGSVELSVGGVVTHRFTDTVTNRRATIYGLAAEGTAPRFDDVAFSPAPRP